VRQDNSIWDLRFGIWDLQSFNVVADFSSCKIKRRGSRGRKGTQRKSKIKNSNQKSPIRNDSGAHLSASYLIGLSSKAGCEAAQLSGILNFEFSRLISAGRRTTEPRSQR
jgi:hypothetical protein